MHDVRRRAFLVGTAATLIGGIPALAQTPKRGGTLRFVPAADLKIVDPIWTTSTITRNHGYLVYDTLFATDASFQVRPQMVDRFTVSRDGIKYSFTLRDGLLFHDGQPVVAEDCVVSLTRWGKKDVLGRLLFAATEKLQAVDKKTFVLELGKPFGMVLEALGKPSSSVPFIMPARLAVTPESDQIKEVVGSGPFRFVKEEWQPGNQVVYVRNADYVPRAEPASGLAGGKRVHLDRVIWRYIPDPATVAAALEAGEVDYWENPPLDFMPRLSKSANLVVFVADPRGTQGWLRPNHLHPPFNQKKARQALLWMTNQEMYLKTVIGQERYYRTCPAYFMCGTPYESASGMPSAPNLERARQLMKEAGYDGRPVVILDPTDLPVLHGASLVTRELLTQIGVTVDLQAMDWSTLVARRAKKDSPKDGGWNLVPTYFFSWDVMTPAVNSGLSGGCDKAWFGWYCSEEMDKLRNDWVRTSDPARRKQLAEQIQVLAADEVPYVTFGQWLQPDAYRKSVRGLIQSGIHVFWNIAVDA
jgi:peptide/nickel transport system substrate-binding protein